MKSDAPAPFSHPSIVKSFGNPDFGGKKHLLENGWSIDVVRAGGRFGLASLMIVTPDGHEIPDVGTNDLSKEFLPNGRHCIRTKQEIAPVAEIAYGILHSPEFW